MIVEEIVLACILILLLALDWRYRSRMPRMVAVLLVLMVMVGTRPSARAAARAALKTPRSERVVELGGPLSDYESGVLTMEDAVVERKRANANARLLALGALVWLAMTPVLRGNRRRPRSGSSESDV